MPEIPESRIQLRRLQARDREFRLLYAVTGKRHLDRGAQQPYPTDAVLPAECHLQRGPCFVAVTLLEPHQRLARLRVGAHLACARERSKRTFEIATQSAYLSELVVTLGGGERVDLFEFAAGSRQLVLERAIVVGRCPQLQPVNLT